MRILPSILIFLGITAGVAGAAPTVLSVDRLYRSGEADLAEAGELLLSELQCVRCHAVEDELAKRIARVEGPNLVESVGGIRAGYLKRWLADPHGSNRGTRMPDVLHSVEAADREQVEKELIGFLRSVPAKGQSGLKEHLKGDVERGSALFHSVGCVSCHAPREDFAGGTNGETVDATKVKSHSVPFPKLSEKYTRAGLNRFLEDPHRSRPSGRKPKVGLTEEERADLVSYLLQGAPLEKLSALPEGPEVLAKGRGHFAKVGCASCHTVPDPEGRIIGSKLEAAPLADLPPNGGCLTGEGAAPRYQLDEFQQKALKAALIGLTKRKPPTTAQVVHRRMVSLNCYACHERGGLGGVPDDRRVYLSSSAEDLGEEGREPPRLSGVGRKMQRGAIAQVIRGQFPVRPYMVTRMPDYGEAHAEFLAKHFAVADYDPKEKPTPKDGRENEVGRNLWGRALMGTQGLSCVTCHGLGGEKSLGIQAMDLAHAPDRLRPEWFRDYLIEPAKFRPGTRMPSFWPGGKPTVRIGGSTERQIDSLWVYLNELDQSRLPVGLEEKGDFLLVPKEKPIVFRTFLERVGMHAIAVGYPSSPHAAYDSRDPRWAVVWTGEFLDAESTWDDRFTPLAKPRGKDVVPLQPLSPHHGEGKKAEFLGYHLQLEKGYPLIHFGLGENRYSDVLLPVKGEGQGMTRTLARIQGEGERWIEVASGTVIEGEGRQWLVGSKLKVALSGEVRLVKSDRGLHLQAKVGKRVTVTYTW